MASSGWNSYGNVAVVEIAFSRGTNRPTYGLVSDYIRHDLQDELEFTQG